MSLNKLLVPSFISNSEVGFGTIGYTILTNAMLQGKQKHLLVESYTVGPVDLPKVFPNLSYHYKGYNDQEAVLINEDGSLVSVYINSNTMAVRCAAVSVPGAQRGIAQVKELIPPFRVEIGSRIPMTFWSLSSHGPRSHHRTIEVPPWDEVEENYAMTTRQTLSPLFNGFKPSAGGQLILWHGPPGTGKTYALRALGYAWREWCDLHYITDPEVFFGQSANYMLQVLLSGDELVETNEEQKWRLLILEDTGEMLSADAKERTGQGLSRLLNVVDGMIGQGLKILVLVTTNEEVKRLHPAVARPGRCASQILFEPFEADEAATWLMNRTGSEPERPIHRVTIAELYARVNGTDRVDDMAAAVGFG